MLIASGQLRQTEVTGALFAGELSLGGELRLIRGIITIVEAAKQAGYKAVFVPKANIAQAMLIEGISVIGVTSLKELFLHLKKEAIIPPYEPPVEVPRPWKPKLRVDDVYGQAAAKRALEIAAARRHNILFTGPLGAGKTMLAKALMSLPPPLSKTEQLAVTKIHSIAGQWEHVLKDRPFRSPHHITSTIALIGGGPNLCPARSVSLTWACCFWTKYQNTHDRC